MSKKRRLIAIVINIVSVQFLYLSYCYVLEKDTLDLFTSALSSLSSSSNSGDINL